MEQTQLPPGWQAVQDPQSGRTYYQNTVTKTTQWEIPGAAGPSPDTQLSGRRSQAELAAIHAASKQQEQQGGSASLTLQQGGGVGGGDGMGDAVSMVISPQPASMTMISAPLSQLNAGGWKNVGAPQVVWEGEEVKVATAEVKFGDQVIVCVLHSTESMSRRAVHIGPSSHSVRWLPSLLFARERSLCAAEDCAGRPARPGRAERDRCNRRQRWWLEERGRSPGCVGGRSIQGGQGGDGRDIDDRKDSCGRGGSCGC